MHLGRMLRRLGGWWVRRLAFNAASESMTANVESKRVGCMLAGSIYIAAQEVALMVACQ
jgi:hypothetical protein